MKQAELKDMFKHLKKSLCMNLCSISWLLVSYCRKTPENTEEYPDAPEPADKRDLKQNTPLTNSTAKV